MEGEQASGEGKKYTCAVCGGTFPDRQDETWNDSLAAEEYRENFGEEVDPAKAKTVCEECYQKLVEALPPKQWTEEHKQELAALAAELTVFLGGYREKRKR